MRAIVLLVLAACASSPRASVPESPPAIPEARVTPAPVNPVGEFEWASALPDGTPIKGTFTVSGTAGAYTGSIDAGDLGVFPIKTVVVTGQSLVIAAEHPDGALEVRLTFEGDDFKGTWLLNSDTGIMAGKRKK